MQSKKIYTKQEIEEYLTSQKNFSCRIYKTLRDLVNNEYPSASSIPVDAVEYNDIFEFTDHMWIPKNATCYYVEGNIFPDNQFDGTEIFINYNKQNQPTGVFINDTWANLGERFYEMIRHLAENNEN